MHDGPHSGGSGLGAGVQDVGRFALLLREWRVARLLTQADLAKRSGVSVRTIRNFEAGRALRPQPNSVRALADALDLTGDDRSEFIAAVPSGTAPEQQPQQLPAEPVWFTGREDEVTEVDKALLVEGKVVAVTAVGGVGGIGKTAFALHWAHTNAQRFPDGQLFVNLRGFDPVAEPMTPSAALRLLLEGMGVSAASMPADIAALGALWRTVVAGKRVLVVLDNARNSAQVEPLLPGTPPAAVLVTSRHQLPGLITTHGAVPLSLGGLGEADATELVRARLGMDRCAADPDAVAELVRRCAGLPLALHIVAARAVADPAIPLATLAAELGQQTSRLDALDAGEITADLRTVFAVSYQALSADAATLFELMGVAPGPDIGLLAAVALFGESVTRSRAALLELQNAHLVIRHHDRYRMHDLVRLYAAERAQGRATRDAALFRVVEHYAYTAHVADQLHPHNAPVAFVPRSHEPQVRQFTDSADAHAWFNDERLCVLAAQRLAVDRGWDWPAWHLAWSLDGFLQLQAALTDHIACWRNGLTAARQLGEKPLLALAYRGIGVGLSRAGELTEGLEYLLRALDLADRSGDRLTQARIHRSLAWTRSKQGDIEQAAEHARQAVRLYRLMTDPDPALVASGLNAEGWYEAMLGHYDVARERCEAAHALAREHHHRELEAGTLDSLGYIAHHTGDLALAITYFSQAVAAFRQFGRTYGEADSLRRLGDSYHASGDLEQARAAWTGAETLYLAQHRITEAAGVREKIDARDR